MLLASLFVFAGCAGSKIPDIPVYKELPFSGKALEVYTVSDKYRIVEKEEFAEMKYDMLMITSDGYAEIKKTLLRACVLLGAKCDTDLAYVDEFLSDLDTAFAEIRNRLKE